MHFMYIQLKLDVHEMHVTWVKQELNDFNTALKARFLPTNLDKFIRPV